MPQSQHRIPLWLKLAYTGFMAVLVPVYLHYYGPTNFLYFCDLALILILFGIWTESALLISMCAVGILLLQFLWAADFLINLAGVSLSGITDYMFEAHRSLLLRGLSLFHGWLPFLVAYLTWKLGYDRRGFWAWTALSSIVLPICYVFLPPPQPNPGLTPVNINYVFGPSDHVPQTWVSPHVWLLALMIGLPLLVYLPTHWLLRRLLPRSPRRPNEG